MKKALNNIAKATPVPHPRYSHSTGKLLSTGASSSWSWSWLWSLLFSTWHWSQWVYWGFKVYRNNQTGRVVLTWIYKACTYAIVMVL